ncbi:MAG: DUF1315 family protein [Pseudomonadales bacterium]
MDYEQLLQSITPEIHANLKRAVELGKWPDGRALDTEQKALCIDAVIAYEAEHLAPQDRVGYIDKGRKAKDEQCDEPQPLILPDN